ncbi:MAG: FkbM family methyltransferase [Desulfuromonadales bacterium]
MLRTFLFWGVYGPLKNLFKLAADSNYRRFWKLRSKLNRHQRYVECNVKLNGWDLFLPDAASFISAYEEIFVNRIYEFKSTNPRPYILDVGANVGVSVLFFKSLFPESEIIAFEADPEIYRYLIKNIHGNGFVDVSIFNRAVWFEESLLSFKPEGADAGRLTSRSSSGTIEVKSINLETYLKNRKVDFLKMDIEGAEVDVLLHCGKSLDGVENIFIEYHSGVGETQRLDQLLGMLQKNGFRFHMHSHPALYQKSPFMNKYASFYNYDLLLNIFAWREK